MQSLQIIYPGQNSGFSNLFLLPAPGSNTFVKIQHIQDNYHKEISLAYGLLVKIFNPFKPVKNRPLLLHSASSAMPF
jgi:hypothetical protein